MIDTVDSVWTLRADRRPEIHNHALADLHHVLAAVSVVADVDCGRHVDTTGVDIDQAVEKCGKSEIKPILLHCVSTYPHSTEESRLDMISTLRERYNLPIGYSGHELGYLPSLIAASMGAVAIERHYTLDKGMEGFDHKISLEPDELFAMVRQIRQIEAAIAGGEKKVAQREQITRKKYHVSMASTAPIAKGAAIAKEMITYRNPGTGLQPKDEDRILGKKAVVDIPRDVLILPSMVEMDDPPLKAAAVCSVLDRFDPELMQALVADIHQANMTGPIFLISELDEVESFCREKELKFIRRPSDLMPDKATLENVLQYAIKAIEAAGQCPDYILYANYLFAERPPRLFDEMIADLRFRKFDSIFPAYADYHNYWTKDINGLFTMTGNWQPHQKREPKYRAINGLGTLTRSDFIRQGRIVGDDVGLFVVERYKEKQ